MIARDDDMRGGGRTNHDIHTGHLPQSLVKMHRRPAEFLGQLTSPLKRTLGTQNATRFLREKLLGCDLGHFAGAQNHDSAVVEASKNALGHADGDAPYRRRSHAESGFGTNTLSDE